MNARQRKFAHEYVKNGFVGVAAVYAAGYNQGYNAARVTASRLLSKANIKSMIDHTIEQAQAEAELTAERTSKEIAKIAYTKVDSIDSTAKMKALDLATKVLGMQVQKVETTDTTETNSKTFLLRRISKLASKSGKSEHSIALEFAQELSNKEDEDYSPELDSAIREVVASLAPATDSVIMEGGDQ